MKIGVVFPQTEIGTDPGQIRSYAIGIEEAGFNHIVAYDHVVGHRPEDAATWSNIGPYTDLDPFHEVFMLFSYLAAITSRVEFATEVLVLPQRSTVLVAKQAAELALLSSGRFRLGVGVGWNPEEFRALGMGFDDRGKRVVEQVEILRRLWSEELTTVHGQFHTIEACAVNPRPPQPIPIWIGGRAPVVLRRAAAIADGFMLEHSLADAPAVIATLKTHLGDIGRDPTQFGLAARIQLREGEVESALEQARAWDDAGISHLSLDTMSAGIEVPERHMSLACSFIRAWEHSGQVGGRL